MELSQDHKSRKKSAYWDNLVGGETGHYKALVIEKLIATHLPSKVDAILDVGCGTSEIFLHYGRALAAKKMVGMDYDAAVVAAAAEQFPMVGSTTVDWRVADIFEIGNWTDRFDLVFLLDMLHEVYSFYGRPNRDVGEPVNHELGLKKALDALTNVAGLVRPGGGIVITDNVIAEGTSLVHVRMRTPKVTAVVRRFLSEYPTRHIAGIWVSDEVLQLPIADFCILLTQYNKLKAADQGRWNVEKLEIHQYMTLSEYRAFFEELNFTLFSEVGTPASALTEWQDDFEVLKGLPALPDKRITLLAVKNAL